MSALRVRASAANNRAVYDLTPALPAARRPALTLISASSAGLLSLGEALGKAYVEREFSPEAKQRVLAMTRQIEKAMETAIKT